MSSQHRQGDGRSAADRTADALPSSIAELQAEVMRLRQAEKVARLREQQLSQHNLVLVNLSQSAAIDQGNLKAAFEEITLAAAHTLDVARASIWLFSDDRTAIRCIDLYQRAANNHSNGLELRAADYPAYFAAIEDNRTLAADDARTDPRTCEFTAPYLDPLGITSMLDAPVRVGGRLIGVICHEHIGQAREWSLEDQAFAGSMADFVALTLKANERAVALRSVRESERNLRQIIDVVPHLIMVKDAGGRILLCNRAVAEAYATTVDQLIGRTHWDVHPRVEEATSMLSDDLRVLESRQGCIVAEELFTDSSGRSRLLQTTKIPLTLAGDSEPAVLGVSIDVTQQREHERMRETMIQELDHRVKNNLAIIQAIAEQTLQHARTVDDFSEAFRGRLRALAISHETLARAKWEGADLQAMVARIVEPFARDDGFTGIDVRGEAITLPPHMAPAVCMIVHELATNAAKHGSLTLGDGAVNVSWEREMRGHGESRTPWLRLTWIEHGGPAVDENRLDGGSGFGTRFISQTAHYQLHGSAKYRYEFGELTCSVEFPLDASRQPFADEPDSNALLAPTPLLAPASENPELPSNGFDHRSKALEGRRVLIVEDDLLVAQSLASKLQSLGCEVVGPASTSQAACALVKSKPIDAAILDVNLSVGTCAPVARALASRNTPFVFVTGYSHLKNLPEDLRGQRVLCKPVDREMLGRALGDLATS